MKTCPKCNTPKDEADFNKGRTRPDGLQPWCRKCAAAHTRDLRKTNPGPIRARTRAWEQANPEKMQDKWLRREYGIDLDTYNALLVKQNYGCAICGTKDPGRRNRHFHVDHDHVTGRVRGLLCFKHNVGLGNFNDSPELLQAAVKYLAA